MVVFHSFVHNRSSQLEIHIQDSEKDDYAVFRDHFSRGGLHGSFYDPAPVRLGDDTGDLSGLGMDEARTLWSICQGAVESLYQTTVAGYKTKLEGMFRIYPDGMRVLPHLHGLANTIVETDGKHIARSLYDEMQAGLEEKREMLDGQFYPDVHVFQISDSIALEKCFVYCEKVVPIGLIVAEILKAPEAKMPDGTWNDGYVNNLKAQLTSFVQDFTDCLFTNLKHEGSENVL